MSEYIYAVTGAVLVSELCMMLMPEGGIKCFAKTAAGILLMLLMLLPLQNCSVKNILRTEERLAQKNTYKTSYSDIIMDIYTQAMENAEVTDGKTVPES